VMVSFGSAAADLAASLDVQVSTPASSIAVGDLDGSGTADVLVATVPGVQTFLGATDRSLDPFSYPIGTLTPSAPILLGVATDLDPSTESDDVLFAWSDRIGFAIAGTPTVSVLPDPTGPVPASASVLAGLPVARLTANYNLGTPPATQDPTLEIALAYVGTQQIFLFSASTTPVAINDTGTVLDTGGLLNPGSSVFFGDFNGDGCRDLAAVAGAAGRVVVFRNIVGAGCTGTFAAVAELFTPPAGTRLFAAADLTADGITDLVTSAGIYEVTGIGQAALISNAGLAYEGAIVVDINGDGALDIAAFRESQPDVEVVVNAGNGVFNRFVVPTPNPVQRLAAGDFDGDLTEDIAFLELDSSGDTVYTLSVAFGAFHGPPGARVPMDRFAGISGMVAANVVSASGEPDAVDDLIVVESGDPMEATVLFGSGARAMTSPLLLMGDFVERPQAIVVGALDQAAGLDLFTIGSNGTAFLFSGDNTGAFTVAGSAPWAQDFGTGDAAWATGDLDADGKDEVIAAERRTRVGGSKVLRFTPADGVPTDALFGQIDGFSGAHTAAIVDLDGDGDLDVLVTFDGLPNSAGALFVGWNHGGDVAALAEVSTAAGCIDAVPTVLDTDAQPELVALCRVVGGDGKERFELRAFDAPEPDTLIARSEVLGVSTGGPTTRLLAADVDGDGLDDLVVSTKGQEVADVRVFLQHDVHDLE
jgi:hypothetical protein